MIAIIALGIVVSSLSSVVALIMGQTVLAAFGIYVLAGVIWVIFGFILRVSVCFLTQRLRSGGLIAVPEGAAQNH
ncbi:hypothetical protein [Actibacterium sp. XHP0104]|uniref:hypothetical protein n=1 Tax=Actibacterium sp. XHP0104 TaxID=2984335 RepID=UPI0021E8F788|nr:hypothetical protein [Actibacterium sp. XHP0104]MCV2881847.1 hypothetical protein [Actibacterium sp. XHP0104]